MPNNSDEGGSRLPPRGSIIIAGALGLLVALVAEFLKVIDEKRLLEICLGALVFLATVVFELRALIVEQHREQLKLNDLLAIRRVNEGWFESIRSLLKSLALVSNPINRASTELSEVLGNQLREFDGKVRDGSTGLIELPEPQRMARLITMVRNAQYCVDAISYVSIQDWWESALGERYFEANASSVARGVDIRRLFLVDQNDLDDEKSRQRLIRHVGRQLDIGVKVYAVFQHHLIHDDVKNMLLADYRDNRVPASEGGLGVGTWSDITPGGYKEYGHLAFSNPFLNKLFGTFEMGINNPHCRSISSIADLGDFIGRPASATGLVDREFTIGRRRYQLSVPVGVMLPTTSSTFLAQHAPHNAGKAADVGCGSGILAIVLASRGATSVIATDIYAEAVSTTVQNAARNGVSDRVSAEEHKFLEQLPPGGLDFIVCNPPTYKESVFVPQFNCGGKVGTEFLLRLASETFRALVPGGKLMMVMPSTIDHDAILQFYSDVGFKLERLEETASPCREFYKKLVDYDGPSKHALPAGTYLIGDELFETIVLYECTKPI